MTTTHLWLILLDALRALGKHYTPAMDIAAAKAGVEGGTWGLLLSVLSFDPAPVSNEILKKRLPYQEFSQRLEKAVDLGLLKAVGEGEFRLSEKGQSLGQQVILAAYARLERLDPLGANDLHYLSVLLHRLVKASHTAPDPPGKWCITHSRRFDPGENAPLLIQVDQYLSDLAAYRDDAHLSAWQPLGFDGPTWETLTMLWKGRADTVDDLHKKLDFRSQPRSIYEGTLKTLRKQNYAKHSQGKYSITRKGVKLREEAEEITDNLFYTPWNCLEEEDMQALENLLKLLIEGLS